MANACARVAVARFLEKACCQSVLDCSIVSKITVDICGYVVFFFLHLSHVSFSTPGQRSDTSLHHLEILPTGEANHSCRRQRRFPWSELETQIES